MRFGMGRWDRHPINTKKRNDGYMFSRVKMTTIIDDVDVEYVQHTLAKSILIILKKYREASTPPNIPHWDIIMHKMVWAFNYIVLEYEDIHHHIHNEVDWSIVQEGLDLFAKHFQHLGTE